MSYNNVIISVSEEELIVSLYNKYLVDNGIINYTVNDTKLSVKAFSDYIMEYLKDHYNLEDEEVTDAWIFRSHGSIHYGSYNKAGGIYDRGELLLFSL